MQTLVTWSQRLQAQQALMRADWPDGLMGQSNPSKKPKAKRKCRGMDAGNVGERTDLEKIPRQAQDVVACRSVLCHANTGLTMAHPMGCV
jgi:hypothetical protein